MTLLKLCKNSMSGKHQWRENIGKNKDKPKCCVFCSQLYMDLRLVKRVKQ